MSKSPFFHATADMARKRFDATAGVARKGFDATAGVARKGFDATADVARKHSRLSMIAASAAAAGVLGASGFAVGAAPWAQAIDNVSRTVQGGPQAGSGQAGADLFAVITGTTSAAKPSVGAAGKPSAGGQLDTTHSATTAGGTGAAGAAGKQSTAAAANVHKPAGKQQHVRQQPVKQQAKPQAAVKPEAAAPAQPRLMYDSVLPGSLPSGSPAAVYADGPYAAQPSQVAGHQTVLWIDTNGSDPEANVLDVEPGDATPAGAAQWVQEKLTAEPKAVAIVYTMLSDWQQVKADIAGLPPSMQSQVRYWIADPTGVPHVVPGASATQWYWGPNYDITSAYSSLMH